MDIYRGSLLAGMLAGMNDGTNTGERVRRSRAEIDAIVADYRRSDLTQIEFARERGLNLGTFRSWLAKRREARVAGFCPVTVRDEPEGGRFTIRLLGGIEIVGCDGADPNWLVALVKGLAS